MFAMCSAEMRVVRDSPEPLSISMPRSVETAFSRPIRDRGECPFRASPERQSAPRRASSSRCRAIRLLLYLLVSRTISAERQRVEAQEAARASGGGARCATCRRTRRPIRRHSATNVPKA